MQAAWQTTIIQRFWWSATTFQESWKCWPDLHDAAESVSDSLVERIDVGSGEILNRSMLTLLQGAESPVRQVLQTRTFWQITPLRCKIHASRQSVNTCACLPHVCGATGTEVQSSPYQEVLYFFRFWGRSQVSHYGLLPPSGCGGCCCFGKEIRISTLKSEVWIYLSFVFLSIKTFTFQW